MVRPTPIDQARRSGRAQYYASRRGAAAGENGRGGFSLLLVGLPVATFAAVFLWDGIPASFAQGFAGGWTESGPSEAELKALYSASEAELAQRRWPTTPAMLDGAQPEFPVCEGSKRTHCVVDGDTFWYRGEKIRIADINTPEVSDPGCPREAALGARATARLRELLNEGAFALGLSGDGRDTDRYGRKLRTVSRNGESLGDTLVEEGLAERWQGRRSSWC